MDNYQLALNITSTVLTVIIGVAVCSIFRYKIFKHPIKKSTASWIDLLVFVIAYVILAFLGFTIKFHGLISVIINYYILTHGYDKYIATKDVDLSFPNTERLDAAFLRIKDYIGGMYDSSEKNQLENVARNAYNSLLFCSAYAIFHANKVQKEKIQELKELLLSKTGNVGLNAQYEKVNQEMLAFKKKQIDPCYIKDNSKESYNRLLETYLKQLCDISEIEWYDGIVEDFKHCMDE